MRKRMRKFCENIRNLKKSKILRNLIKKYKISSENVRDKNIRIFSRNVLFFGTPTLNQSTDK